MRKIFNGLFYVLKFLLFLGAFGLSLFIMFRMYTRLEKSMTELIKIFIPYVILLIMFFINIFAKQKGVGKNLFYNLTCCIVFITIIVIGYRSIFDNNMILKIKSGYDINFHYYSDALTFINVMLYGLSFSNLFFMFSPKENNKTTIIQEKPIPEIPKESKEEPIAVQIETL